MADYLTYGNLSSQVSDLIDDDSGDMGSMIDKWINNAYRKLWRIVPQGPIWTESGPYSFTMTQGTSSYNLSASNPGQIVGQPTVEDLDTPLEIRSGPQILRKHKDLVQNGNGTPVIARFRQVYFGTGGVSCFMDIFPPPDSGYDGKKVYYNQLDRFTAMSASTQVPKIPAQFHDALLWGATFYASFFAVDAILASAAQQWNDSKKDFRDYALELIPDGQMIEYGEQVAVDYDRGI